MSDLLKIWAVSDGGDSDYIVIAGDEIAAIELAGASGLEVDDGQEPARATDVTTPRGLRWVGFDSDSDALVQLQELLEVGVAPASVQTRATMDGLARPLFWEVGARDADWIRLGAGYLCGGGE